MAKTETTTQTVTMDDGRVVEFAGKTRMIKTALPDYTLRLDYVNGETRTFKIRPDMIERFATHGAAQKLGDEASGIADIEDAIEAIDQLILRLDAGEWGAAREAGSGMAGASVLAKALVKVTGQPIAIVRQYLSAQDNKVKAALRVEPAVNAVIRELEAEKAARAAARGKPTTTVDTAAVLEGLKALA